MPTISDDLASFLIETALKTGCAARETENAAGRSGGGSPELRIRFTGFLKQEPACGRVNYVLFLRRLRLCDSRLELTLVWRSSETLSHKGLMGARANRVLLAGSVCRGRRLSLSDTWQALAPPGTPARRFGELLQAAIAELDAR